MIRQSISLLLATSLLGGCYSFRGPQPVLGPSGVVTTDRSGEPRREFFFTRFRDLAYEAAGCVVPGGEAPLARCTDLNVPVSARQAVMQRYMRAGFALIYNDCMEYFAVMGRNQGRSRIARDLIAPVSALITGIISLRNLADGDEQTWLTGLSLATTTTAAGIDIFEQRFLFGSDNIDSVRELISRALTAQANAALAVDGLNFESASNEILNNQMICTPSAILRLTRGAIQAGRPASDTTGGSSANPGQTTSTPLTESITRQQPPRPVAGQGVTSTSVSVPQ